MFVVLISVVLITTIIVGLNIEMSLEKRIEQDVIADIAENPEMCQNFPSIEACIEYFVNQRLGQ